MVYGVFGGCYSDWYSVGYFTTRLEADKYCAAFENNNYYVIELKDLTNEEDLSKVSLKYKHSVVFDYRDESDEWVMREEPDRYECYVADELKPNSIDKGYSHVRFDVNIIEDNRKLAEKIAQDYLAQLLAYGNSKQVYEKNVKLMNDQFIEPFKIAEQKRKQEEIRQKELAELDRLKQKYESE